MARYVTQFELAADVENPTFATTLARALQTKFAEQKVDVSARRQDNQLLITVWVELDAPGARNASDNAWHAVRQAAVDAEAATFTSANTPTGGTSHEIDYMPDWLTLGTVDVRHVLRPDQQDTFTRTAQGAHPTPVSR